jgi:excinuclease ABC subunit A
VKLATELSRRSTGRTLYILDEPTTGLSFEDVAALLRVLQRLVDAGNTVVLIEHHLDLIKCADYIIDLGPGGGDRGGWVVATGTPEEIAEVEGSYTGQYLREKLGIVGECKMQNANCKMKNMAISISGQQKILKADD